MEETAGGGATIMKGIQYAHSVGQICLRWSLQMSFCRC